MVTFYLKTPNKPVSHIWVQGYANNGRIRKSTGFTIDTRYWRNGWINPKGASVEDRRKLDTLESHLKHLRNRLDDFALKQKVENREVTTGDIGAIVTGKSIQGDKMFSQVYLDVIRMAERGQVLNPKNGSRIAPLTIRSWVINRKLIMDTIGDMPVEAITTSTVRAFAAALTNRGRSKNSVGVQVKGFKTALSWMHRLGLSINTVYTHPDFRPKYEYVDKIYLTPEEIQRMCSLDLSHKPDLALIRDAWLVMYYTGLRVSDAHNLTSNDIQGDNLVTMNHKTKKVVVIPISTGLREIIERYNGFPKLGSDQVINRGIKTVALMSGITDNFTFKLTRMGVSSTLTMAKWELVSCHTARRSAATNMIRAGISHDIGGDMLGMTQRTWGIYNRLTPADKADQLRKSAFFQQ
jgi:integrase